jgi:hypothetical protein
MVRLNCTSHSHEYINSYLDTLSWLFLHPVAGEIEGLRCVSGVLPQTCKMEEPHCVCSGVLPNTREASFLKHAKMEEPHCILGVLSRTREENSEVVQSHRPEISVAG